MLRDGNVENHIFDAGCITESALNMNRSQIIINYDKPVDSAVAVRAAEMAEKRISGYPLQYLTGMWEFYGLPFYVGEGVLIPRQDTELLVENVLKYASRYTDPHITDLCSGSGCIAISLDIHMPEASVDAVELSDAALGYLKKNAALNGSDISIFKADVLDPDYAESHPVSDIIVSNPPYLTAKDMDSLQAEVAWEPDMALYGGDDGLDFYRRITQLWKNRLSSGGMLFFETGAGQDTDVSSIMKDNGFHDINVFTDLNGINRVVSGVYR